MKYRLLRDSFVLKVQPIYTQKEAGILFSLLSSHFLKWDRITQMINEYVEIEEEIEKKFNDSIRRLNNHEPIQYIINISNFFGYAFYVDHNVLIPRPETEELVEWILSKHKTEYPLKILDIGTGSGCIPIVLSKKRPKWNIVALDSSSQALTIATKNSNTHSTKIEFFEINILQSDLDAFESFDIIISNPPYVLESEKEKMTPQALEYEPQTALFAPNQDPFIFYRRIAYLASKKMNQLGCLYFEINEFHSETIKSIVESFGFECELKNDISGKKRMLKGRL